MRPSKPESDGFLAMIEAKIVALKALADSYRAAQSLGAIGQSGEAELTGVSASGSVGTLTAKASGPVDLPQGALLGMSLPAAIKLYLSAARRKQTTREVTTALKEHGVESTSRNFENTVTTALHRLKTVGDVLKFNDGWALAEFYPENLRRNLAAQAEGKKTKATKAKKRARQKKGGRLLSLPPGDEPKAAVG